MASEEWIESKIGLSQLVSGREYELVSQSLLIPDSYFDPKSKVLSVGEGLSDYSKQLKQKYNVTAVAVDPIYALGKGILIKDPKEANTVLQNEYLGKVEYGDWLQKNGEENPLPDEKQIVAGNVYRLPFPDSTFDLVVTNRMVEHVDLSKALPELVRVLSPNGELRIGGIHMSAQPEERKLFPHSINFSGKPDNYGYYTYQTLGAYIHT